MTSPAVHCSSGNFLGVSMRLALERDVSGMGACNLSQQLQAELSKHLV